MRIGGIIDISTKDIPGKTSMVIFTTSCNFKCEFCHNKYLLYPKVGKDYTVSELIDKVKINLLVSGVSITGGEPTLQDDLVELCQGIATVGKYVSIDTNGSNPDIVKNLIPYINRVALDLKCPLDKTKLEKFTGVKVDPSSIIETFNSINSQENIDFEIRTTYVEKLMIPEDIHKIIMFLKEERFRGTFVLQQYQYSEGVGELFKDKFQKPNHGSLLNILKPYLDVELPFELFIRDNISGYSSIKEVFEEIL